MAPMKLRRREATSSSTGSSRPQREVEQEEGCREERNRGSAPSREERNRGNAPKKNRKKSSSNKTKKSKRESSSSSTALPPSSPLPSSSSRSVLAVEDASPDPKCPRSVLSLEDTSPDSKCPICLDRFNNLSYLDRCLHRFCFTCIQEWSRNKAECPLCKQPFSSILHSVRSHSDFKKYTVLRPRPELDSVEATIAMVAAMAGDERMRLTLRRDREDSRRNRHGRNRRSSSSVPLLEWIVHAPPGTLLNQPLVPPEEERGFNLSQPGIVFEGLTGLGPAGNMPPFIGDNRETRRLLAKLAARQRLQREGGTVRPLRDREMIALRRGLYRCGIRVRGVARGGSGEQPQRGVSAESFCQNPSSLHRLRPWLRRELTVLYGAHDPLITIVVRLILNALARLGLEDLEALTDELRPFLLARTEQFLHELNCFARSPLNMENYDLQAVYEPPDLQRIDSSDSSVVINISEDEERAEPEPDPPTSLSGWDDETPGPSYTTVDTSCFLSDLSPAPRESTNQSPRPLSPASPRQQDNDEVDECLIVGYKKPIAERTPELVQLSSDSEEEKEEKKKERGEEEKERDGEKGESGGKEATETNNKRPESICPTTPCREEIVEDARPSRSPPSRSPPSLCLPSPSLPSRSLPSPPSPSLPSRSLPSPSLPLCLSPESPPRVSDSRRRKREQRRNRRLRIGSSSLPPSSLHLPPSSPSLPRFSPSSLGSDSDWAPGYSLSVSPLHSSLPSTPLSSSSSSCFSPSPRTLLRSLKTPPPRNHVLSQSDGISVTDKPGGKRKYKSRHLDCDVRDPTWRPGGGAGRHGNGRNRSKSREMERLRREEREKRRRRRRKERTRRESGESRCRDQRSPSVEIIYEGTVSPTAKRKRTRPQRHSVMSSSPLVITLDSDSPPHRHSSSSVCSSPFGSQQTLDFCHFPSLPLVHSSGVGGALGGGDIGQLPVDILDRDELPVDVVDRESEKSGQSERLKRRHGGNKCDFISLENSSDASTDIDIETIKMIKPSDPSVRDVRDPPQKVQRLENKTSSSKFPKDLQKNKTSSSHFPKDIKENKTSSSSFTKDFQEITNDPQTDMADRKLLDSILSGLDGILAKSDNCSQSDHPSKSDYSSKSDLPSKSKTDHPSTSDLSFPQENHFMNFSLSKKPKNSLLERFHSPLCPPVYPPTLPTFSPPALPTFLQLTENKQHLPQNTNHQMPEDVSDSTQNFDPTQGSAPKPDFDPKSNSNSEPKAKPCSDPNPNPNIEVSSVSNKARTFHDLDSHRELADSLLALRDSENSGLTNIHPKPKPDSLTIDSLMNSSSSSPSQSTAQSSPSPNTDSLLLTNLEDLRPSSQISDHRPDRRPDQGPDHRPNQGPERLKQSSLVLDSELVLEKVSSLGLDVLNTEDVK